MILEGGIPVDSRFTELCERAESELRRLRVPGAALGVWHRGREYLACYGKTSVEHPLRVNADTMFQIGSITKTMTATALASLAYGGAPGKSLDLDSPVRDYLPGFTMSDPEVARRVTTRQLLSHTGGWIGDYFDCFGDGDDALATMVERIGRLPQVTPLGSHFSYNNAGFNIASRVLELAYGKPYERAIEEMLFKPLGLTRSFFYPSDVLITHRFVAGHDRRGRRVEVQRPWAIGRAGNGVGGGVLSIRDLLAYARLHLRDGVSDEGRPVVPAEAVRAMREPQADAGARGSVCLSWFLKESGGVRYYSHGGATNGQQAYLTMVPGEDFAAAVLTNAEAGGIVTDRLRPWVAELWFGADERDPEPLSPGRDLPEAAFSASLDELAGEYELPLSAFSLRRRGPGLILRDEPRGGFPTPDSPPGPPGKPMRAVPVAGDRLLVLDEPRKGALVDVLRDRDGRVAYLRLGGRVHPRKER